MLKPIATPHPVIIFISLALLSGLIWYSLRSNLEKPEPWIGTAAMIFIICLCETSRARRARRIRKEFSHKVSRARYPAN